MKKIILLFFSCLLFCSVSFAEEAKVDDEVSFWQKIRTKIEKITPKKKPTTTTAVGGVRGLKDRTSEDLYWRGKTAPEASPDKDLELFTKALNHIEAGEDDLAQTIFANIIKEYPQSDLLPDAKTAFAFLETKKEASKPKE